MESFLLVLFSCFVGLVFLAGPLTNVLGFVNNIYKELHK